VKVLVCDVIHPLVVCGPSTDVTVTLLQLSVAVAVPRALLISCPTGLQMNSVVPVAVITGAWVSTVHDTVLDAVDVFPQASIAVHVRVCVRLHPLLVTAPSEGVIVGMPHASVAVPVPNAASICAAVGLHPAFNVVPDVEMLGGVLSTSVIVCDTVAL
jgi:hypothetical protein